MSAMLVRGEDRHGAVHNDPSNGHRRKNEAAEQEQNEYRAAHRRQGDGAPPRQVRPSHLAQKRRNTNSGDPGAQRHDVVDGQGVDGADARYKQRAGENEQNQHTGGQPEQGFATIRHFNRPGARSPLTGGHRAFEEPTTYLPHPELVEG